MFEAGLPVTTVLSDRPCAGLDLAEEQGAAAELVDRTPYGGFGPDFDRAGFTATVAATLVAHQVDLVAMAGFGTVMTETVHRAFPGRILNTHPACSRPSRVGMGSGTPWRPASPRLAAPCTSLPLELDAGPILAQEVVPVLAGRHRGVAARTDQGGRALSLPGHRRLGAGRVGGRARDHGSRPGAGRGGRRSIISGRRSKRRKSWNRRKSRKRRSRRR